MRQETWFLFVAMIAALSCVPGPAVLLVISSALQRGFRIGIAASLGILAGNLIYFALSGTSIGAMLVASRRTYLAAKWAGAA